ncbi:complex I subunit 5 family protein [Rubellimicrobium sp. CFH 75288]|uniref:complex I subunit 5 family protein n=1 Tax=Rubellimicrobium sp. CFH 75288 TaxID=2697034 RepID=UPI00141230B1|nr:proton-conducting transporter membrane subunit [Rubellimicrobium sp. CFH 75288]NAZ36778.1 hypothetical protein [Rubellimicrobium sp. CFH 75288]
MTVFTGDPLALLALVWPLALALVACWPRLGWRALDLLPLASLPALALAVTGGSGGAPDVLLGLVLAPGPEGRLLLGMVAVVWLAGGLFARGAMARGEGGRIAAFSGFWCLTFAGNAGVMLAGDAITFYASFTAVSLAAWGLVIHDRTAAALTAGRVYLVLALVGEVCLLMGLLIAATAADGFAIGAVRAALAEGPHGALAAGLLVAGLGIKAGMVPLHVWLPLAHPAAPVPGSAVLSGAIVKAGVIGMLILLPDGDLGIALIALGLVGAFGAALWGLTQENPKAILAYSTVSQIGIVLVLAGVSLVFAETRLPAAAYAAHHGLAKAALFLSVGLVLAAGGRWRAGALALAALAAASVAGAPATGGAAAKAIGKAGLPDWLSGAVTATGITTTILLVWFLVRLRATAAAKGVPKGGGRPRLLLWGPPVVLTGAALVAPVLLMPALGGPDPAYLWQGTNLVEAIWPVLAGIGLLVLLAPRGGEGARRAPLPPGDLLTLLPHWRRGAAPVRQARAAGRGLGPLRRTLESAAGRAEARLVRWRWSGVAMALTIGGLALLSASEPGVAVLIAPAGAPISLP